MDGTRCMLKIFDLPGYRISLYFFAILWEPC